VATQPRHASLPIPAAARSFAGNISEREEPKIRATAALDADHVPHALGHLGRFLIRELFIHVE
jgi:hypothetical protein